MLHAVLDTGIQAFAGLFLKLMICISSNILEVARKNVYVQPFKLFNLTCSSQV